MAIKIYGYCFRDHRTDSRCYRLKRLVVLLEAGGIAPLFGIGHDNLQGITGWRRVLDGLRVAQQTASLRVELKDLWRDIDAVAEAGMISD